MVIPVRRSSVMAKPGRRGGAADDRILVVVLGQTRAWELTFESFTANLLDQLGADLALCGGDRDERENPFYERAKYVWRTPEPDDWAEVYDRTVGDSSWRVLLSARPAENLFGGIKDTEKPQEGSGALLMYSRRFLGESLERAGITEAYDWLIVTRSDFLWPLPHPDPRLLSDRRIYVFDGEQWGGVSDRHFVVPRRHVKRFLRVPDPVFTDPERLRRQLDRRKAAQDWGFLNIERFWAARLKDLGLWRTVRFLPYVPFLVRAPGGSATWSKGVFDEELGYYVKYPAERELSQITQALVRDQESWRAYLAPVRGALKRHRLRTAYRERGLYERPFPLRELPIRAFRIARWSTRPHQRALQRAVVRIGKGLRRVPWMRTLLDSRVRHIERRAERRHPEAAERRRATGTRSGPDRAHGA
jgi:hypothetical protein